MTRMIDISEIRSKQFHSATSYRAAVYVCGQINAMMKLAEQGIKFFDDHGEFVPDFKVDHETMSIAFKDGEGCWVVRVGDRRHERSGRAVVTKTAANEWLKTIRYVNPNEYKRLRIY